MFSLCYAMREVHIPISVDSLDRGFLGMYAGVLTQNISDIALIFILTLDRQDIEREITASRDWEARF